jgi:hypothetical protein
VSGVLRHLLVLLLLFAFLLSILCIRSSLLSISLVMLILLMILLVALLLVDYLIPHFIFLPCFRSYSLAHVSVKSVVLSLSNPNPLSDIVRAYQAKSDPVGHCPIEGFCLKIYRINF